MYSLPIRAVAAVYKIYKERRNGITLALLKVISTGVFSEALVAHFLTRVDLHSMI